MNTLEKRTNVKTDFTRRKIFSRQLENRVEKRISENLTIKYLGLCRIKIFRNKEEHVCLCYRMVKGCN